MQGFSDGSPRHQAVSSLPRAFSDTEKAEQKSERIVEVWQGRTDYLQGRTLYNLSPVLPLRNANDDAKSCEGRGSS